jgi:hypothetical protein
VRRTGCWPRPQRQRSGAGLGCADLLIPSAFANATFDEADTK